MSQTPPASLSGVTHQAGAACYAVEQGHRLHCHSTSVWLVGTRLPGAAKSRMRRINAGDTTALLALVGELRARPFKGTSQVAGLACCFEAGRDGFWLHRLLTEQGVPTYVVEPASIRRQHDKRAFDAFERPLHGCGIVPITVNQFHALVRLA